MAAISAVRISADGPTLPALAAVTPVDVLSNGVWIVSDGGVDEAATRLALTVGANADDASELVLLAGDVAVVPVEEVWPVSTPSATS